MFWFVFLRLLLHTARVDHYLFHEGNKEVDTLALVRPFLSLAKP